MSSIAGQQLFESGPHRFVVRAVGRVFLPPFALDFLQETTFVAGPLELWVRQTGRLVAQDGPTLWELVELIRARAESALHGTLITNDGRSWSGMTLLRFRPEERVDRGRLVSLAYDADYIRLAT